MSHISTTCYACDHLATNQVTLIFDFVLHSNLLHYPHECWPLLPLLSYASTALAFYGLNRNVYGGKHFVTMHLKRIMGYLTFLRVIVCAHAHVDQKVSWWSSVLCWTL